MNKKLFLMMFILLSCLFINNVYAEDGYTTDTTGISLRDKPDRFNSNVISTIPYHTNFYISNMSAGSDGGCSSNWYYVYYNGQYGYVCSSIVHVIGVTKTSYNRPWSTPKKAIIGGAMFIGTDYISKGQYTAYTKKFNVNPLSYYGQFKNQYMANMRAPAAEAYRTYNALSKNNLLNLNYNFSIPVYDYEGADQTYSYKGVYSEFDLPTTTDTDDAFETMIKDFPDSYKPYLRAIHKLHNNWTFTPLQTNLKFTDAATREQGISSIEVSSGYCDSPTVITEDGWCISNIDTARYFLDVRNFLNEKYVFMFQDLGYNDSITESVIQNTLNGTFMSGQSALDSNQSYASIFVEAGKNDSAKVSPLYLVSLSLQEVGTNGSFATSGKQFTYEGYTYAGLYNYFNIGASSSESNPVLAGLVYANGGEGTNNGSVTVTPTEPTTPTTPTTPTVLTNDYIGMLGVSKVGAYIKGYNVGTNISTIKAKASSNTTITIMDDSGNVKTDSSLIGTANQIKLANTIGTETYTYVLYGDLTGDGEINSADLLRLRQHLLGINILNGAKSVSANLTNDSEINSADLLALRKYLLGTTNISQQ